MRLLFCAVGAKAYVLSVDHDCGLPFASVFSIGDSLVTACVVFAHKTVASILALCCGSKIFNSVVSGVAVNVVNVFWFVTMVHNKNHMMQISCFSIQAKFPVRPSVATGNPPNFVTNFLTTSIGGAIQISVLVTKVFSYVVDHVEPHMRTNEEVAGSGSFCFSPAKGSHI
jgi:hypothetical protein